MRYDSVKWNEIEYQKFIKELFKNQDLKYQSFHSKLVLDKIPIIGIRSPILHSYSKSISKGDYLDFIKCNTHYYYEEIIIHGLLLGYLKISFYDLLILLEEFLPYNTNWAINDSVCANLKEFKKNQEMGYKWILNLLKTNNPWTIRFGFVLLLNHYINDDYIDSILYLTEQKYINHYYVNMAIAWLVSMCYIKYPDKTETIIKNKTLDTWIHNKTISKIRDSYQVSKEKKDYLKQFNK